MRKTSIFAVCLMLAGTTTSALAFTGNQTQVQQQRQSCRGVVKDAKGEMIIGATVQVKGTTNGTITGLDGDFSLSNVSNGDIILISYVGYDPVQVVWKGSNLNIVMKESAQALSEVVVTGYGGKQSRMNVTNSIAKVKDETFKVGVFSNPAQALSGAVSGLRVMQTSGNPGAAPTVVLRGGTNLDGSGSPLVIVDGQLRGSLSDINPEDIESMDVMKDAGATAIYGARASNGVIMITTKSGKAGHSEINFKAKVGLNYIHLPQEFLGAKDYITYQRQAYANAAWASTSSLSGATPMGTGNVYGSKMAWNIMGYDANNADQQNLLKQGWQLMNDPLDPTKQIIYKDTPVQQYAFNNPSVTQDYNVNMSGGNDKGTYYAGLGYNNSEGAPVTSYYKRYSFLLNGTYQLTKWLKSTSNFNYNRANWQSMPGSQGDEANYFGRLQSVPPTARFVDENGNNLLGSSIGDGNQYFQPNKWNIDNQTDKFTMTQSFEAKLMKNLTLKTMGAWYYSEGWYENFTQDYQTNNNGSLNTTRNSSNQFSRGFTQTYNLVLNYNAEVAPNHNLDLMLGTEYYDLLTKGFYAAGSGAPTDAFQDLQLTSSDKGKRSIDSWHSEYRILSYFGRANYNYMGKYLLSAVFRYDGYSSLLGNNRWGFFPGLSAGWLFYKEDFVKNAIPALSFGKLRASYGVNGNASTIGAYTLQGSYNSAQYNGNVGYLIGTLPNPGLRWERTTTQEIGLDLSFFNNRLNGNLTYYNRLTSDKQASMSLPSTTGFSSITNNNGSFRNRGVEFDISADILKTQDMLFKVGGNISYNKNIVVSLPSDGLPNNRQGGMQIYTGKGNDLQWVGGYQEGQEPGVLVAYVFQGIYKTKEEIPGNLVIKSGNVRASSIYGPEAYAALSPAQLKNAIALQPGDAKWKDINGDGMIDSFDQVVVGNTTPHWIGGLNFTFSWKGFTLYSAMDYAFGFWNYDPVTPWYLGDMQGTYNASTEVLNSWTATNVNAKYPRYVWADQYGAGNYYRTSTLFAFRGDYLSFREVSLSYTLPKAWAQKIACQQVDFSITGQNLGYLRSSKIAVPESIQAGGAYSGTGYPLPRTVLFGVNVKF